MRKKFMAVCCALSAVIMSCGPDPLSIAISDEPFDLRCLLAFWGSPLLMEAYSDEFEGAALDPDRWHDRVDGWIDQNPPAKHTWSIARSVTGGELVITPEPSPNADWWNHWYGPGVFSNVMTWDGTDVQIDLSLWFTPVAGSASHFAALIVQDTSDEFHYIKFAQFGSNPRLYDMNVCFHHNPWPVPSTDWAHYLQPTEDLTLEGGTVRCTSGCWSTNRYYDSWTKPQDTVVDFPVFLNNIFAAFVQHTRTADSTLLRIVKRGDIAEFFYSEDDGATFTRAMSAHFNPPQVRIGMVANEMGVPMGGDARAHFRYIRVWRL